jgi:hypothetical protein
MTQCIGDINFQLHHDGTFLMLNHLLTAAASALIFSTLNAQAGECPAIGVAPRTIGDTAEAYATSPGFSLNDDGILEWDYGAHFDNLGKWADPFFDSNYALALYRDWLSTNCTDEALKAQFLKQANWLANGAEMRGDVAVWSYPFADKNFDLGPGWVSGIGQSRIAGVLLRAEAITNEKRFHDIAQAALRSYEVTIDKGGVVTIDGDVTWIEEMADPKGRSFKVLNGHITGLAGIADFYTITRDPKWKALYDRAVAAVKRDIEKFDAGFSTYYSLVMPSSGRPMAPLGEYNALHVAQLIWLYNETNDGTFLDYASRYQAYELNADKFTASSSIDSTNHGPDRLRAKYGSEYWSVGKFPAWLELQTPSTEAIKGVSIDMNLLSEAPSRFTVSAKIDGEWVTMGGMNKVTSRYVDIMFPEPAKTDAVRIDIAGHSGDGLVALRAVMLLRASTQYGPLTNDCNNTAANHQYNISSAFDGDLDTSMKINCDGWLLVPTDDSTELNLISESTGGSISAEQTDDFSNWQSIDVVRTGRDAKLTPSQPFVRIRFSKEIEAITEITGSSES